MYRATGFVGQSSGSHFHFFYHFIESAERPNERNSINSLRHNGTRACVHPHDASALYSQVPGLEGGRRFASLGINTFNVDPVSRHLRRGTGSFAKSETRDMPLTLYEIVAGVYDSLFIIDSKPYIKALPQVRSKHQVGGHQVSEFRRPIQAPTSEFPT